jgi:hypothetical protein
MSDTIKLSPEKELTAEELTSLQQLLSAFNQAKIQLADATMAQQDVQTGAITRKEDGSD